MDKLFCIIFKTLTDSMKLLVNPKLLSFKGFSYPEEDANADPRVPMLPRERKKIKSFPLKLCSQQS